MPLAPFKTNFGTGVQPARHPRLLDTPAAAAPAPAGRNLGSANRQSMALFQPPPVAPGTLGILNPARSRQLDAAQFKGYKGPNVPLDETPVASPGIVSPTPRPVAPQQPFNQPDLNGVDPDSTQGQNILANAGIYRPGSTGAVNAVGNGTGATYKPPQQTERANPLSGDNNIPLESTTTAVAAPPAPFVQRGTGTPRGQDVAPAANESIQADIAGQNADTQQHVGGVGKYARPFSSDRSAQIYHQFTRQLFGGA